MFFAWRDLVRRHLAVTRVVESGVEGTAQPLAGDLVNHPARVHVDNHGSGLVSHCIIVADLA